MTMTDQLNHLNLQQMIEELLTTMIYLVLRHPLLYGQLHSDIITITKRSISPDFKTVHKERDIVGLLSILRSICVQNLTGSKVDPYLEHLKIMTSTLSNAQKKGVSNHHFGDAIYD